MAKIDTLTFEINGETYTSNVNVGKSGVFTTDLAWQVGKAIGLESGKLHAATKDDLVNPILKAYHNYLESETTYALFIGIVYKSNGWFAYDSKGHSLFGSTDERRAIGFSLDADRLEFDYEVYCKESSSTGNEIWHNVTKVREDYDNHFNATILEGYRLDGITHSVKGKVIPYSKEAIATLAKAREGIRGISEILCKFLEQDTAQIVAQLNGGNLLDK